MFVSAVAFAFLLSADPVGLGVESQFEVLFLDGSTAFLMVSEPALELTTKYGLLKIPMGQVKKIDLGFRYPDGMEAKIIQAMQQLGSKDFHERERGHKALLDCKEFAVPQLKIGLKDPVPEVAERCATILNKLQKELPEERFEPRDLDQIVSGEQTLRGRITSTGFKAKSPYFGEATIRFADLKSFRVLGSQTEGRFTLTGAKHASVGWKNFLDTGFDVELGQPIEISAKGKVKCGVGNGGMLEVGPQGTFSQVYGPGKPEPQLEQLGGRRPGNGTVQMFLSGALYGRIGEKGPLFKIGPSLTIPKSNLAGRLYLVIAPGIGDSSGEFEATVKVGD